MIICRNLKVRSWIVSVEMLKVYLEICFLVELVIAIKREIVRATNAEAVYVKKRCAKVKKETPTATITQIVTTVSTAVSPNNGLTPLNVQL